MKTPFAPFLAILTTPGCAAARPGERPRVARGPKVLSIVTDDLGCYGQKPIKTPIIDTLARGGVRFVQAYSGCCVCPP